jgi:hypothetical protein
VVISTIQLKETLNQEYLLGLLSKNFPMTGPVPFVEPQKQTLNRSEIETHFIKPFFLLGMLF